MDIRGIVAIIVVSGTVVSALLMIIYGMTQKEQGVLLAGSSLISAAFGSIITFYFGQEKVNRLKNMISHLNNKIFLLNAKIKKR